MKIIQVIFGNKRTLSPRDKEDRRIAKERGIAWGPLSKDENGPGQTFGY